MGRLLVVAIVVIVAGGISAVVRGQALYGSVVGPRRGRPRLGFVRLRPDFTP